MYNVKLKKIYYMYLIRHSSCHVRCQKKRHIPVCLLFCLSFIIIRQKKAVLGWLSFTLSPLSTHTLAKRKWRTECPSTTLFTVLRNIPWKWDAWVWVIFSSRTQYNKRSMSLIILYIVDFATGLWWHNWINHHLSIEFFL